jgi:hypothetical protein
MEVKEAVNFLRVNLKGIRCTEPHRIANLLESMESENKVLKQENEAYKGIVEEIANDFGDGILQNENGFGVKLEHLIEIKKQKYKGGF